MGSRRVSRIYGLPVVVPGRVEHVEHRAGGDGAGRVALVGRDVEDLARPEEVGDAGDGELEGAAQEQGPLLVGWA